MEGFGEARGVYDDSMLYSYVNSNKYNVLKEGKLR